MSDPGPRQAAAGPAEAEQVRLWLDDIRAVLRELEGMSHRSGGAQGAAVDCRSDLARVLADLEALPRLSTAAAFLAASAANSGARYLLTVATGSGSIAEPDDSAWWVAHAMWLLGRAQQHADVAHGYAKHADKPGTVAAAIRERRCAHREESVAETVEALAAAGIDADPAHVRRLIKAEFR